jgi:hypothetical protein
MLVQKGASVSLHSMLSGSACLRVSPYHSLTNGQSSNLRLRGSLGHLDPSFQPGCDSLH